MNRRHRILPSMFNFLGVIIFVNLFLTSKSSGISYSTFSLCAFTPSLDSDTCWDINTRYSLYDNWSNPDKNYTHKHGCDGKDKTPQLQFSLTCAAFPSTVQDNSLLKIICCLFSGFNQSFLLSWDDADIPKQDWVARCRKLVVAPIQNCVKKSDSVGGETSIPVLQALGLTNSTLRMCDDCRLSNRYCSYVYSKEWKSACFCDEATRTCKCLKIVGLFF